MESLLNEKKLSGTLSWQEWRLFSAERRLARICHCRASKNSKGPVSDLLLLSGSPCFSGWLHSEQDCPRSKEAEVEAEAVHWRV